MTVLGFSPERRVWDDNGAPSLSSWLRLPTTGALACWAFTDKAGSLVDLVSGITLTAGTHVSVESFPEFGPAAALHFNGGINADLQTADTSLRIAGDITIELICRIHESQGGAAGTSCFLVSWMNSGSTEADNVQYRLALTSRDFACPQGLRWQSESGAGATLATANIASGPPVGQVCYLAATRISNVVRWYLNGRLLGTSASLATPTGGNAAAARLCIGGDLDNGDTNPHWTLFSAAIHSSGLSQATIQSRYTATLGNVYPIAF